MPRGIAGARRHGSRWTPRGLPAIFTSATLSLAALERFVNTDPDLEPADLVSIAVDIDTNIAINAVAVIDLPADWRKYPAPPALAMIGERWLLESRSTVLAVPSAVIPHERNFVLNPTHADFVRLKINPSEPFSFDPSMLDVVLRSIFAIMTTIGLIGAGNIGSQIARLAMACGHRVVLSNSRGPETLSTLIAELGPNARAATAIDAAKAGDIVVVTVPLKNYRDVPVEALAGKIVIDTNNYYPQRDGHIPELDNESTTTAELLQTHLPTSKVVKAFNHIQAAHLTTDGQPAGSKNRRGLVIAGDDAEAKDTVAHLLNEFGFDTVDAGPLKEGWRIQRDTPGYGPRRTADELRRDLAAAKRYADQ